MTTQESNDHEVSDVVATFGFVDLAGFTALTEAHGDAEAVALLDLFEAITWRRSARTTSW